MKKDFLKAVLSASTLLAAAGYGMVAQAHCVDGQSISTVNPSALQDDVYVAVCPTGTHHFTAKVGVAAGTPTLMLEVGKGGVTSQTTHPVVSDTVAGGGGACQTLVSGQETLTGTPSPSAIVTGGGAGQYTMVVSKNSASQVTNYGLEFHCYNAVAESFATELALVRQQGSNLAANLPGAAASTYFPIVNVAPTNGKDTLDVGGVDSNVEINLILGH